MEAPAGTLEDNARRLQNALVGAVLRSLRRQESLAIAVSGGLDSSVLAALIQQYADVPLQLVTIGGPGAVDPSRARALSRHLRLPVLEVLLSERGAEALLPEIVPLIGTTPLDAERAREWGLAPGTPYVDPVLVAVELPLFLAMREAGRFARRIVLGQGADEHLLGYHRYQQLDPAALESAVERDRLRLDEVVRPAEARLAEAAKIQPNYPYLDPGVVQLCLSLPREHLLSATDRKIVLRRVARDLGLPNAIADAPKTAAQYGSGAAEILRRLAERAGVHQNEYLARFLDQRKMGEPHSIRT